MKGGQKLWIIGKILDFGSILGFCEKIWILGFLGVFWPNFGFYQILGSGPNFEIVDSGPKFEKKITEKKKGGGREGVG